ncbi:MAG TPA: hypothetical protein ENN68_00685 [Methanomicrobia archaeon]|nr:hypothetical protein [Methanomicrobia archaeon]
MEELKRGAALIPACRVFFAEYLQSDLFIEHAGATQLITPTGACCQRLYAVGAIESVEARGTVVRIQLNDSTASVPVYAAQDRYPAEPAAAGTDAGRYLAIAGAVTVRAGADGSRRARILAEALGFVDDRARAAWLLATAQRTLARIEQLRILSSAPSSSGPGECARAHYALDTERLDALSGTAITAVSGLLAHYRAQTRALILDQLTKAGTSGLDRSRVLDRLRRGHGLPETWIGEVIDGLIFAGECSESESSVLRRIS